MNHFQRKRGVLQAEEIPLESLAEKFGTPLYVYSSATLTRHWKVLHRSLAGLPHLVCYAVKANSNLAVLSLFARLGSGFDIVSAGELFRVIKAGGDPGKVVYSGVGKRDDEIEYALKQGVRVLDVESAAELGRVAQVARRLRKVAPIALRVNPAVDPKTHPYIATGLQESKFGVAVDDARQLYGMAAKDQSLEVRGVAMHIGSQITTLSPFLDAVGRLRQLVNDLAGQGIAIHHIDLGGGLGVPYDAEQPPSPEEYGQGLREALKGFDGEVLLEPGRLLVANAGILLTRVLYTKRNGRKAFVVVDAGMNDLLRPSLYGAFHAVEPVKAVKKGAREITCDVVGPICESGDFLAQDRLLPESQVGDLLCIRSAGAYGFAMSSTYNSRPRAAEVLVDGDRALLARRRETFDELIAGESARPTARKIPAAR
jgi:diaminopimelate decarboxylase